MDVTIPSRRLLMRIEDLDARWHALSEEVMTGMKDWRVQHPKATFREIEAALDERLARLRARMLEDALLVSRAAEWEATDAERPVCPQCGTVLQARGRETRTLTTDYDQALQLERRYAVCPRCQAGLFPPG
jgi:ribosomal protein S27AE